METRGTDAGGSNGTSSRIAGHEAELREALLRTYFRNRPAGFPSNASEEHDLADHLHNRFRECEEVVLPWVAEKVELDGIEILEIGCGTGSSTASFARHVGFVHAYDIVDRCVDAANERLRIMGIPNARCHALSPEKLLERVERDHGGGIDLVLLYAVMEHQTLEERLATLDVCWRCLRPGGHLVVADSPNRLCYKHYHTSEVSFFDMLPEPLAFRAVERSPREVFRVAMGAALDRSVEEARAALARWGTGISHHEFEAVLGPLEPLVVGDGFDPRLAAHKPLILQEELLLSYLAMSEESVPLGFARVSIDVILRKPDGTRAPIFQSHGERHAERIHRRMTRASGEVSSGFDKSGAMLVDSTEPTANPEAPSLADAPGMPTRVDVAWARKVAEDSLNGRILVALALRKLARKVWGG